MADVERATSQLLALLADNTVKAISEQDLRDVLVSLLGGYGAVSVLDGAAAQSVNIAAAKLECFAADGLASSSVAVDHSADRVTPSVAATYQVSFSASYVAPAGRTVQFRVRVNQSETALGCQGGGGAEPVSVACSLPLAVPAGGQVEVYVEADQDATSVTVRDAQLSLKRIG